MEFNGILPIEKFPGKGGWTYVLIPGIEPDKENPFSWTIVSGNVNDVELNNVKLMPYGQGKLFLPLKVALRRVLKKNVGDYVSVRLSKNTYSSAIITELLDVLSLIDNNLIQVFENLSDIERINWNKKIFESQNSKDKEHKIHELITYLENYESRKEK